jgi:hypothetical protein
MEKEIELTPEPSKRLKESEWLVVSSLWEMGEVTLKELSEKFGVSEPALSQGLKRRGIKRGSKAHLASKEIETKIRAEKEQLVEEIFTFKKRFLKYGDFLMTLTMNEITEAKKNKEKLFSRKNEIETIIAATKVYKTIRNDMFHLYDLYNPDNQPQDEKTFNIGVYDEQDIKALRESQEMMADMIKDQNAPEPEDDDADDIVIEGLDEDEKDDWVKRVGG